MHATAGTLNRKAFGLPVVPPLTREERAGLWEPFGSRWVVGEDPKEFARRGVCLFVRRSFQFPFFGPFDPPNTSASCPSRQQTTVPTQALALLNSQLVVQQARAFAGRLLQECGAEPTAIVSRARLLAYGRPVGAEERTRVLQFWQEREDALDRLTAKDGLAMPIGMPDRLSISNPRAAALTEICLDLFNTNEFVYVD